MLRETVEAKINKCIREIRDSVTPGWLQAQIVALSWVQGLIQHIIINSEDRDNKILIYRVDSYIEFSGCPSSALYIQSVRLGVCTLYIYNK
jgi:hypothetical protein